jgi:hypothetical protein
LLFAERLNERFSPISYDDCFTPLRGHMTRPLPPTVYGPITPFTPEVRVSGVLTDADVIVVADGQTVLGRGKAPAPGELWVKLTIPPKAKQNITAVQSTTDPVFNSWPSPNAVVVVEVPLPLPTPVISSDLNSCMTGVLIDGLVPGAKVIAIIAGQTYATTVAARTSQSLDLDPTKSISANGVLEIHQELTIDGLLNVSPTVKSLPIAQFQRQTLDPPQLFMPLFGCKTLIRYASVASGATILVDNGGRTESSIAPNTSFLGHGGFPLKTGKLVVRQEMPRCRMKSADATFTVEPPGQPSRPAVTQQLCPKVLSFTASQLTPGGTLHIIRHVQTGSGENSSNEVGSAGIAYETQQIDLPADIELTDPAGLVYLDVTQDICTVSSPSTAVSVATSGGPYGAPKVVEPVYDCARALRISGAHPGSCVQALDGATKAPLSDIIPAPAADFLLKLWFPAHAGMTIVVAQTGCNADGYSGAVRVNALPDLPQPHIQSPIRPGAISVVLSGILPGARVYVLVDGAPRMQMDSWSYSLAIYLPGPPLQDGQQMFARQSLCDKISRSQGLSVTATKGNMKVSVSPTTVARGTTAQVTVTAVDADTNAAIAGGHVYLSGAPVGTTGSPFSFSPKAADATPVNGQVHEDFGYYPGSYHIDLIDQNWTLQLVAAPTVSYVDSSLRVSVDQATWIITPQWNTALARTITANANPPNVINSIDLPQPPAGGVKTVQIAMSMKCSTPGGNAYGISFQAQTFPSYCDPITVGFNGHNIKVSYLVAIETVSDDVNIAVSPHARFVTALDY